MASILCMGGCVCDRIGETEDPLERLHTSNIGRMRQGWGGVARNVAENLARLGVPTSLASQVGDDADGAAILAATEAAGVDISRVARHADVATASYTAIFNGDGELVIGLADMAAIDAVTPALAERWVASSQPDAHLFVDANLPRKALDAIASSRGSRRLAAGPVSQQKVMRLAGLLDRIDLLILNRYEALALTGSVTDDAHALVAELTRAGARCGVLTCGPQPALVWQDDDIASVAPHAAAPRNVNGAGDSFAAGVLARSLRGDDLVAAAHYGMAVAALTVAVPQTVRPDLSLECVAALLRRPVAPTPLQSQ